MPQHATASCWVLSGHFHGGSDVNCLLADAMQIPPPDLASTSHHTADGVLVGNLSDNLAKECCSAEGWQ